MELFFHCKWFTNPFGNLLYCKIFQVKKLLKGVHNEKANNVLCFISFCNS